LLTHRFRSCWHPPRGQAEGLGVPRGSGKEVEVSGAGHPEGGRSPRANAVLCRGHTWMLTTQTTAVLCLRGEHPKAAERGRHARDQPVCGGSFPHVSCCPPWVLGQ